MIPGALTDEVLEGLGEVGLGHDDGCGRTGDGLDILSLPREEQARDVGPEAQKLVGPVKNRPELGDVGFEPSMALDIEDSCSGKCRGRVDGTALDVAMSDRAPEGSHLRCPARVCPHNSVAGT